jgi:hypothetical protein
MQSTRAFARVPLWVLINHFKQSKKGDLLCTTELIGINLKAQC